MKVGFIGSGKMAEAIIAALVRSRTMAAADIHASDISEERCKQLKHRYGINTYSRNMLVATADIVFLAIKPQQMEDVLTECGSMIRNDQLVISIAAGKKIASLQTHMPHARIVRVMPNLPCTVGAGMSVFCAGPKATAADTRTVQKLLACVGEVTELPEDRFDVVTAVSGSGPAFFAYVLEQMVQAGTGHGLERKTAMLLATQTMLGTAKLLMEKELEPQALIDMVTSPKGTTAAGREVLERSDLSRVMSETIAAAVNRSVELGK